MASSGLIEEHGLLLLIDIDVVEVFIIGRGDKCI